MSEPIDLGLAVERLLGTGVEYGSAASYERLRDSWQDKRPLPSLEALHVAWNAIAAEKEGQAANDAASDADKAPLRDVKAVLEAIQARRVQIASDRAALPTATTNQMKSILDRLLAAEDDELALLTRIVRAISRIV